MKLPADFNTTELELFNYLMFGKMTTNTTIPIYKKLDDYVDKLIVALVFDLGFPRKLAAEAIGISTTTLWYRIKKIRNLLKRSFMM